jgi:hypothetical protein
MIDKIPIKRYSTMVRKFKSPPEESGPEGSGPDPPEFIPDPPAEGPDPLLFSESLGSLSC